MSRLRVLSLGAGVQSTTLALMAAHGEFAVDCAIFADTQSETLETYRHLEWLMSPNVLPFPVHVVTRGNLEEDFMAALAGEKTRCGQPPFHVRLPEGDGLLRRECTSEYKLDLIRRKVRELATKGRRMRYVEQLIGISTDEAHRMKESGVRYIKNVYPLVERRMSRGDCVAWLKRHEYPIPGKSACYFCPLASNERWRLLKRDEPAEWARACAFDDALRLTRERRVGIDGEMFVHHSLVPLREADLGDERTLDLFDPMGNECEGMCGV